jgi:tRNA dimethylallyltransferase
MAFATARADTEIVAIDAMQVYRGMDIGTAKPTAHDQLTVPHHCIDLVEPSERFTVAEFQAAATSALASIASRQHVALMVAGTGLYLTAVIDELSLPGEWPEIRAELEAEPDIAVLYARLQALDPQAAQRIERANRRRITRALEVCLGSGQPFSSFGPGTGAYPPIDTPQIGLRWNRTALAERIERRVRSMLDHGFVKEVERLLESPAGVSPTARQALGYRELIEHIEGRCSLSEATAEIVVRTRQFAVRQERWFRRDPRIRWVDIIADPVADVVPIVQEYLP